MIYTDTSMIEFKKWGLLHIYVTLTLTPKDKLDTPERIDEFIFVEIPNKETDPVSYEIAIRCMLYVPCEDAFPNVLYMVNGKCSIHYPKKFCVVIAVGEDVHTE